MSGFVLPPLDDLSRPIFLGGSTDLYCIVDLEDFEWARQWKWKPIRSRGKAEKVYAFRTTRTAGGRHVNRWLHKEVLLRAMGLPPSRDHVIGDHLDGQSLNDRRPNLRWATVSQNNRNIGGIAVVQLRLAIATGEIGRVLRPRRQARAPGGASS